MIVVRRVISSLIYHYYCFSIKRECGEKLETSMLGHFESRKLSHYDTLYRLHQAAALEGW